jgi:hypothetical protein
LRLYLFYSLSSLTQILTLFFQSLLLLPSLHYHILVLWWMWPLWCLIVYLILYHFLSSVSFKHLINPVRLYRWSIDLSSPSSGPALFNHTGTWLHAPLPIPDQSPRSTVHEGRHTTSGTLAWFSAIQWSTSVVLLMAIQCAL